MEEAATMVVAERESAEAVGEPSSPKPTRANDQLSHLHSLMAEKLMRLKCVCCFNGSSKVLLVLPLVVYKLQYR
jgi:hypothetical protein